MTQEDLCHGYVNGFSYPHRVVVRLTSTLTANLFFPFIDGADLSCATL
jgi:hypothetical protein